MKILLLISLSFVISLPILAGTPLPFNQELRQEINLNFIYNERISLQKLNQFEARINEKIRQMEAVVTNYYSKRENEDAKEVEKEIDKDDALVTYRLILDKISKIRNTSDIVRAQLLAAEILELEYSAKIYAPESLVERATTQMKAFFDGDFYVPTQGHSYPEASNLYNPETNDFYTEDELYELVAQGYDISLLDPNPKSTFWQKTDIESLDIEEHFYSGSALIKDFKVHFPKGKARYQKVRKTQTKPKFHIELKTKNPNGGKKIKRKYKLKVASEVNSEVTASALATSLGFYADISKYYKDFKMILNKGTSVEDVKAEWYSYFGAYDFDKYIKETGWTNNDREYIIFSEAVIEAKPEELLRLGHWAYGMLGHTGLRELRGQILFNIWIANTDLKVAGNNKLILKKNNTGEYDMIQFTHDLGSSFGHKLRESPNDFKWNVVKSNSRKGVTLDYHQFQPNDKYKEITYYDAKWMVRKIARLSRKQITAAVELGGWPKEAALLLIEKLISRRNDMVQAFDLEEEVGILPFNKKVSTDNGILTNGQYVYREQPGQTVFLGNELQPHKEAFKKAAKKIAVSGMVAAAGSAQARFDGGLFGLNPLYFGEIEYMPSRKIEQNLSQTGEDDYFLVHDSLRIKFELGAGILLRGRVSYIQEYRISYPVRTYEEGMYQKNFIVDMFLQNTIKKNYLPKNSVLSIRDGFEGSGELRLQTGPIGVRSESGIGAGEISTTFVARKDDKILVSKEKGKFFLLYKQLDLRVLLGSVPLFDHRQENGLLGRETYKLEYTGENEDYDFALNDIITQSSTKNLKRFGEQVDLFSNYVEKRSELSILFWKKTSRKRQDLIQKTIISENGELEQSNYFQVDIENSSSVSPLIVGEIKSKSVRFLGEVDNLGEILNPVIDLSLTISDVETNTEELQHYISSINRLALSDRFIDFKPAMHTANNRWGLTNVEMKVLYTQKAINKLMSLNESDFYEVMARFSNRDASFWKSRSGSREVDRKSASYRSRFQKFVNKILKAQRINNSKKKYKLIVEAINGLIKRSGHGYSNMLLHRLNTLIGRDNLYIESSISVPEHTESQLMSRLELYNELNPELAQEANFFEFNYEIDMERWEAVMSEL